MSVSISCDKSGIKTPVIAADMNFIIDDSLLLWFRKRIDASYGTGPESDNDSYGCINSSHDLFDNDHTIDSGDAKFQKAWKETSRRSLLDTLFGKYHSLSLGRTSFGGLDGVSHILFAPLLGR